MRRDPWADPAVKIIQYEGIRYMAKAGETILDALLRQGVAISHSCRKGSCGCCQLRLLAGQVTLLREGSAAPAGEGHVLGCVCTPEGDLVLGPPDLASLPVAVEVVARHQSTDDILLLDLAPLRDFGFLAGQHVDLIRPDGLTRPYSIASLPGDDYSFRIHVRHIPGGAMSGWLHADAPVGTRLHLRGPAGDCVYRPGEPDRPLLVMATGTGIGPMAALVRDALAQGHAGPISLYHGVRGAGDLYCDGPLRELAGRHGNLRYRPCVSGGDVPVHARAGRVVAAAAADHPDLDAHEVYLCGQPAMVEEARVAAVRRGAGRSRIHADPFAFAVRGLPRDAEKLAALAPEPELWEALGQGPGLTRILEAFYARVYVDARLSPFFQGVAIERAVQKQYEFLADLFSGRRGYFGFNPTNAHHWMVISDELFDHREALFEQVLREQGLDQRLARRWLAIHELFRAEIVKSAPHGLISRGVEQPLPVQSVERLDIDALCDGCSREIAAGSPSRYQHRLGTLLCSACAGLPVTLA